MKRSPEPYEEILLRFAQIHVDIRRLENMVVQRINKGGVSWERIGEVVDMTDEGARRHYTKADGPRRRKKTKT
jgi:hypothetical protein